MLTQIRKSNYNSQWFMSIVIVPVFLSLSLPLCSSTDPENTISLPDTESTKLLVLLIDGFRWDYYARISQKHQLPGFRALLANGVQAEYVEPIFPSLSYPSWTTLITGLYPSHHNILGNYMVQLEKDESPEAVFQLKDNSTKNALWWQSAEPLWTTATKAGQKVYVANFGSCEVPFDGIVPADCSGYQYHDVNLKLRENLNKALTRFRQGFSLAMIYDDSIDHAGHSFGPESNELRIAVSALDSLLQELYMNMRYYGLHERVNLIITSDHGMTSIKKETGTEYVKLADYILDPDDTVYKVIDYGAIVTIIANKGKSETLVHIPGVDVYRKQDIPEEFHYKEGTFVHDILLVAKPGFFIVGLKGEKQIPNESKAYAVQPYAASHGYYNSTDMRTIFYARGPAFRKGLVHPFIRIEDEYQIFTKLLNLEALPNNGTWKNVEDMFDKGTSFNMPPETKGNDVK